MSCFQIGAELLSSSETKLFNQTLMQRCPEPFWGYLISGTLAFSFTGFMLYTLLSIVEDQVQLQPANEFFCSSIKSRMHIGNCLIIRWSHFYGDHPQH